MNNHTRILLLLAVAALPLLLSWRRPALWTWDYLIRIVIGVLLSWGFLVAAVWLDEPGQQLHGDDSDISWGLTYRGWIIGVVWAACLVLVQTIWNWAKGRWSSTGAPP